MPSWSKTSLPAPGRIPVIGHHLVKGMARALAEVFPAGQVPEDLRDVSVKISGCHNSCAQHHIATIGLHGVRKRLGEHTAPHYELHLGGHVDGTPKIGQLAVKLPAKSVPAAVRHLVDVYRRDRTTGESLAIVYRPGGKTCTQGRADSLHLRAAL